MRVSILCLAVLSIAPAPAQTPVEVEMRNVRFHADRDIVLYVHSLRGRMTPTGKEPVTFDDPNSFIIKVDHGEIAIDERSLGALLNRYAFGFEGSPIRNLTVRIERGELKQSGTLHKGVDLPFEVTGTLSVTDDGQIRMHSEKVKSAHVPVKGLLHLFGEHLDALVKTSESRGVKIEGDDFILNPQRLIPPPRIEGKVVKVRAENTQVVMELGGGREVKAMAPSYRTPNYIYHRGGILRFGKLTMQDADLEIVDDHPRDPFEFSLKDYNQQLVAGYSKNTPNHGLIVFMPDSTRVGDPAGRHR